MIHVSGGEMKGKHDTMEGDGGSALTGRTKRAEAGPYGAEATHFGTFRGRIHFSTLQYTSVHFNTLQPVSVTYLVRRIGDRPTADPLHFPKASLYS